MEGIVERVSPLYLAQRDGITMDPWALHLLHSSFAAPFLHPINMHINGRESGAGELVVRVPICLAKRSNESTILAISESTLYASASRNAGNESGAGTGPGPGI